MMFLFEEQNIGVQMVSNLLTITTQNSKNMTQWFLGAWEPP